MLQGINLKEKHRIFSKPTTDVEHRTSHPSDEAILNVFETRRIIEQFDLKFSSPVVVSMIQGKKVMHLKEKSPFEFTPGQSIVMPASEMMYIDFPEANQENPTQCMALEISDGFVKNTLQWLNEMFPKVERMEWSWTKDNFLLLNNEQVEYSMNRLVGVLVRNAYGGKMMASNATRELIATLMQTQARAFLLDQSLTNSNGHRLAHVVSYIRKNLNRPIKIDQLSEKACLSRAQFFRAFQREMGETPVQFVNRERLAMAKRHMLMYGRNATQACFDSGFSSLNYFSRLFRQYEGISPTEWLKRKQNRLQA